MTERILYFDCFSGIAGDMTLGALIDLGVDQDQLIAALKSLDLPDWSLSASVERRQGLRGINVEIWVGDQKEGPAGIINSGSDFSDHGHGHDSAHHAASNGHNPDDHTHGNHRHYRDIVDIIAKSGLPESVKKMAVAAFDVVAEAEADVHGVSIDDVHFHEVGAVDSIVDIVGVAWCLWSLKIDRIESAPLPLGRGFITCAHGRIPLPAPATLLITKGLPVVDAGLDRELVTPTGAAFIKAWGTRVGPFPTMRVSKIGWGFGDAEFPDRPNALRLVLGDVEESTQSSALLETNVDDMTPELLGHLMDELLNQGALDVWFTPIQMKKNRPGIKVSVLIEARHRGAIENTIFAQSSAIGLRYSSVDRRCLDREMETVETPWGDVQIKVAYREGVMCNVAPEFDDCRAIANASGIPIKVIYQHAITAFLNPDEDGDGSI
ncbi:MAG: TIGR00299 family protein [Myxococcales bacterium]|nr:TIGR00299 family protein [Myxococcales bacterium]